MADEKIITSSVFEQGVTEIMQDIANNLYEFEEYTEDEVKSLFDVESPEKLAYYESLINPDLISENKLWSSKTIADKIAEAIVESNSYADGLITNITSIQLEWCETSLPTTGETNKIYILPVTSGSDTVNTLNIWNSKTSAYVSIGNLEIDLSQYYTKSEMDTKLNDKANKSEVLAVDKVQTVTGSETNDTVYSSKLTKIELDKKANLDDMTTELDKKANLDDMTTELDKKVDKDSIATVLDDTVTDEQVPSAKAVVDGLNTKANDDEVVKKTDIVDNLTSTDTDKPLSANQGMMLKSMMTMLTGVVLPYAGSTAPNGFLLCDGQAVSRTQYKGLFDVIGTTYGSGDGSTTFNLPNLQDKFIQGAGTNVVGTKKSAGLPNITGSTSDNFITYSNTTSKGAINLKTSSNYSTATITGSDTSTNTKTAMLDFNANKSNSIYGNSTTVQPPAVVMNYIIKY